MLAACASVFDCRAARLSAGLTFGARLRTARTQAVLHLVTLVPRGTDPAEIFCRLSSSDSTASTGARSGVSPPGTLQFDCHAIITRIRRHSRRRIRLNATFTLFLTTIRRRAKKYRLASTLWAKCWAKKWLLFFCPCIFLPRTFSLLKRRIDGGGRANSAAWLCSAPLFF